MMGCKKCGFEILVKNGFQGKKQRYKCKQCGASFVVGDERKNGKNTVKIALALMLYGLGNMSFRRIAMILDVSNVSVLNWIRDFSNTIPESKIDDKTMDVEFDEMWHFVALRGELLLGLLAIVTLKRAKNYTKDLNT